MQVGFRFLDCWLDESVTKVVMLYSRQMDILIVRRASELPRHESFFCGLTFSNTTSGIIMEKKTLVIQWSETFLEDFESHIRLWQLPERSSMANVSTTMGLFLRVGDIHNKNYGLNITKRKNRTPLGLNVDNFLCYR